MACREQTASDNFEGIMTRYTFAPTEFLGDPIMKPTSKDLTCRHDWQSKKLGSAINSIRKLKLKFHI